MRAAAPPGLPFITFRTLNISKAACPNGRASRLSFASAGRLYSGTSKNCIETKYTEYDKMREDLCNYFFSGHNFSDVEKCSVPFG